MTDWLLLQWLRVRLCVGSEKYILSGHAQRVTQLCESYLQKWLTDMRQEKKPE